MAEPMSQFRSAVCVLDTCSIINLDEIVLAGKDVLFYVRQSFDLYVSSIIQDEFLRHRALATSREASYWKGVLSNSCYTPSVLNSDAEIIGPFYSTPPSFSGNHNAGEHANTRVALELFLTRTTGHTIFVTDDEKARNAFLGMVRRAFPSLHVWTSVDVILYLGAVLLKEGRADFEGVRAALRDVYAARAKWEERDETAKSAIIRNQRYSVESLRILKEVTSKWRN
ncbi:MAG TPA: hypothetical protein VK581_00180 [Chthoniobacterales bacterium]|nr:hypothetical protein [Chthoniobacterales bacterium]